MTGRAENLKVILAAGEGLWKVRDKNRMNAMAYACQAGSKECIEVLLDAGCKVNTGCGEHRMPPLSWAAAHGRYEICEWLLKERKANVLAKDKTKRCALTMAVRNGHLKVASLLMQHGADVEQADSSGNAPLHFAAAYGWMDCIELLLNDGKANINVRNTWNITPINIAMLMNHVGCVKQLLNYPEIEVNCKDEKGRNLLMLCLYNLNEGSTEFISFLLEKGADPNMVDIQGRSALHHLTMVDLWAGLFRFYKGVVMDESHSDYKEYVRQKKIV